MDLIRAKVDEIDGVEQYLLTAGNQGPCAEGPPLPPPGGSWLVREHGL